MTPLTEHLFKAKEDAEFLRSDLLAAHTAAISADERFAQIVIMGLIEDAAKLVNKMRELHAASLSTQP